MGRGPGSLTCQLEISFWEPTGPTLGHNGRKQGSPWGRVCAALGDSFRRSARPTLFYNSTKMLLNSLCCHVHSKSAGGLARIGQWQQNVLSRSAFFTTSTHSNKIKSKWTVSLKDVLATGKMINFSIQILLNLKILCDEMGRMQKALLLGTKVQWLSGGKVLLGLSYDLN